MPEMNPEKLAELMHKMKNLEEALRIFHRDVVPMVQSFGRLVTEINLTLPEIDEPTQEQKS